MQYNSLHYSSTKQTALVTPRQELMPTQRSNYIHHTPASNRNPALHPLPRIALHQIGTSQVLSREHTIFKTLREGIGSKPADAVLKNRQILEGEAGRG